MAFRSFLADADDFLTDLLFDKILWQGSGRTAKMNRHRKDRRMQAGDMDRLAVLVTKLRRGDIGVQECIKDFCAVSYVKSFLRTSSHPAQFQMHLKRYLEAMLPQSGIAFLETDRYLAKTSKASLPTPSPTPPPHASSSSSSSSSAAITTSDRPVEVAVFATRKFKKGETIHLKGGTADLTEEQDDMLRLTGSDGDKRDFSVIYTARKQCFSLLLGPARFVNHDCRNNVVFHLEGKSMRFKCTTDIEANEEIFTNYGQNYFEWGNAACLCASCEQLKKGAFTPKPRAPPAPKKAARDGERKSGRISYVPVVDEVPNRRQSAPAGNLVNAAKLLRQRKKEEEITKRRSERTTAPLQGSSKPVKRLVHLPLPPPPGYANYYEYNQRREVLRYKGPAFVGPRESASPAPREVQRPAPKKRGRPPLNRSTAPSSASSLKAKAKAVPLYRKRRRVTLSGDAVEIFSQLDELCGFDSCDDDISDISSDDDESTEEEQGFVSADEMSELTDFDPSDDEGDDSSRSTLRDPTTAASSSLSDVINRNSDVGGGGDEGSGAQQPQGDGSSTGTSRSLAPALSIEHERMPTPGASTADGDSTDDDEGLGPITPMALPNVRPTMPKTAAAAVIAVGADAGTTSTTTAVGGGGNAGSSGSSTDTSQQSSGFSGASSSTSHVGGGGSGSGSAGDDGDKDDDGGRPSKTLPEDAMDVDEEAQLRANFMSGLPTPNSHPDRDIAEVLMELYKAPAADSAAAGAAVVATDLVSAMAPTTAASTTDEKRKRQRRSFVGAPRPTRASLPDIGSMRDLVDSPENGKVAGKYPASRARRSESTRPSPSSSSFLAPPPPPAAAASSSSRSVSPSLSSLSAVSSSQSDAGASEPATASRASPTQQPAAEQQRAHKAHKARPGIAEPVSLAVDAPRSSRSSGLLKNVTTRSLVDSDVVVRVTGGAAYAKNVTEYDSSSSSDSDLDDDEPHRRQRRGRGRAGQKERRMSVPGTTTMAKSESPAVLSSRETRTSSPQRPGKPDSRSSSQQPRASASRRASTSASVNTFATTTVASLSLQEALSSGKRTSRSSGQLPSMRDIVDAKELQAVAGGWDAATGRYLSHRSSGGGGGAKDRLSNASKSRSPAEEAATTMTTAAAMTTTSTTGTTTT